MSSYRELVERNFTVLAEEWFGSYQGDIVFLVQGSGGLGVIVTGYGSCSGCDWLEAAWGNESELDQIAESLANSVHYGTKEELRAYLVDGDDAALSWYFHESGFADAVDTVLSAA